MTYVYNLIDLCRHNDVRYHNQSLVILESSPKNEKKMETESCTHFFDNNKVSKLITIERLHKSAQIYLAIGLRTKYHFSCPTFFLASLYNVMKLSNNGYLTILFIPRMTKKM